MTDTPEFAKIRALAKADRRVGACDTPEIARIRAALAAAPQPAARGVPEGWRLVPAEPTQEMYQSVIQTGYYHDDPAKVRSVLRSEYQDMLAAAPQPAARGVPSAPDPSDPADIIAGALSISRGHAIEMMRQAVKEAQPAAQPCPTCESLAMAVMMDQTAHDMNLVAEKYAHKLALDLECVLADYSGKWWDSAIKTIGDYRSAMNAIHERESPTFMGEPRI